MPIEKSQYQAPSLLPTGHLQTVYPYFFRKPVNVSYQRLKLDTPDGDFLDLDFSFAGKSPSRKCLIITHGLESSSQSNYVTSTVRYFNEQGYDVLAWNMRGCGGEMNRKPYFYHSGQIEDLDFAIKSALDVYNYREIYLTGFSLGAGMTAIYLGKMQSLLPSEIKAAVLFSTPCCLKSSGDELSRPIHKLYAENFLSTMRKKVIEKSKIMELPNIDLDRVRKAKTFTAFDNALTAPSFGYESALDYYQANSCKPYLKDIAIPTLIVNAKNDPFLGKDCYPIREAHRNELLYLEMPSHGGHLGFTRGALTNSITYTEFRTHQFFDSIE
jgi:uncharacterized protein